MNLLVCAECGEEGGSLKACKACMLVKYCCDFADANEDWQVRIRKDIIHVAGRTFAECAYTPVGNLETISVRFAIQR
jgi:hypothetical protein